MNWIAEVKVGWVRLNGYLGFFNFLMILGIWLDRHYAAYVVPAYVTVIVFSLVGIVVDRWFIWPREQRINERVGVLRLTECFRSAKHLVELEQRGVPITLIHEDLTSVFEQIGLGRQFEEYYQIIAAVRRESA